MPWTYNQTTGVMLGPNARPLPTAGYSGHGEGLNNPTMEHVENVGPIPVGTYLIGPAFTHPVCGPVSMRLKPYGANEMFGRDGFLIHGDNAAMNHSASDGCIILQRPYRVMIDNSPVRVLVVVSGVAVEEV